MNVGAPSMDLSRSIQEMGNMLKNITSSAMNLQEKLMKVSVTEKVTDPSLGGNLDVSA